MDFLKRYAYDPKKDFINKGGFSKVYKAYDTILDRTVALKVFTADQTGKYDLITEIKKAIQLEHPNLCRFYDVELVDNINALGEEEKFQIGVMEYIESGNIREYCKDNRVHKKKLLLDVLKGLAYLHKKGLVHRDLKPQNILIKQTDEGPVAKLTDFGISKMVDTDKSNSSSALMGTIEFMAPEQFNPEKYGINGKIGTNLDLWSFGLLVYTMETGHSLFGSQTGKYSAEQIMSNILSYDENKIEETVPDPLTRMVIQKCLVKDARKRIQKADELISVLENGSTISEDIRSHPPSSQTEVDETILLKPPVTSPPVQPKTPVFSPVARGVNTSQHEVARPEKQGFMTVIIVSVFLLICVILIIAKVSS